ncbi:hypothetical protein [Glaciecola sp. SC05]|uniref:hypothetical protein n=1 Tax=Glaciecola sp. SC05 TaxID=1987355 RepID=UPI003528D0B5
MRFSTILKLGLLAALPMIIWSCSDNAKIDDTAFTANISQPIDASFQVLTNRHFKPPVFEQIKLQTDVPGAAIWGATGRDNAGKLYFGLSTYTGIDDTSYLVQYDPKTGTTVNQSDTVSQLKKAKLYFRDLGQNKLHSKFLMADDGYLYFSSFDETGETGSRNPVYGGNLWRKLPESENWEHLLATDEALIAVNVRGRFVYALGYWDHVLYQYDTVSQVANRITVGSIDGHISRNFVVNSDGYAFVPRVEKTDDGETTAVLVEINSSLAITDIHPLEDYTNRGSFGDHGIVSYTLMMNGDVYFTVATGGLYHITESSSGRYKVNYLGKFEPQFENSYIASMFSPDGTSLLVGLGRNKGTQGYYWYIRELNTQVSVNYPIESIPKDNFLLYGSHTIDNDGNLYIVGRDSRIRDKHAPVVIKASYPVQ